MFWMSDRGLNCSSGEHQAPQILERKKFSDKSLKCYTKKEGLLTWNIRLSLKFQINFQQV